MVSRTTLEIDLLCADTHVVVGPGDAQHLSDMTAYQCVSHKDFVASGEWLLVLRFSAEDLGISMRVLRGLASRRRRGCRVSD